MKELSKMQQKIYDYIAAFIQERGYPPSVREIGDAVGLKSPSTVHFHLKHLEEAGVIEKAANKGRALVLARGERKTAAENAAQIALLQAMSAKAVPTPAPEAERRNQVPIMGNVAAGSPILAQECIEDYLTVDVNGREDEYFALRVRGESMLGAGILPGDLVVVKQQDSAHNGEIVVALLEEEATVKTYLRKDGHVWLLPENENYAPIDGDHAQILGRVAMVVRRY